VTTVPPGDAEDRGVRDGVPEVTEGVAEGMRDDVTGGATSGAAVAPGRTVGVPDDLGVTVEVGVASESAVGALDVVAGGEDV
jgi:hypothetical protein